MDQHFPSQLHSSVSIETRLSIPQRVSTHASFFFCLYLLRVLYILFMTCPAGRRGLLQPSQEHATFSFHSYKFHATGQDQETR